MRGIKILSIIALFLTSAADARQTPKYDIYSLGNDRNTVLRVRENFKDLYENKLDASYLDEIETIKTPVGTISMYGGASSPEGWMTCDGAAVSRTTYAALYSAIGTTYGTGDGSTTFNLPDFRGLFPKGAGTTNRAAGKDADGNYYAGTLGAYSQDMLQGHYHALYSNHTGQYMRQDSIYGAGGTAGLTSSAGLSESTADIAKDLRTDGTNGTPRTGATTEPQSLTVTFIIKY